MLAGSGAIREHGLTDRPTQDVDLFTMNTAEQRFAHAVDRAITTLDRARLRRIHGPQRSAVRQTLVTKDDQQLEVALRADASEN